MIRKTVNRLLPVIVLNLTLTSCDGMFEGLYDDEVPTVKSGMESGQLSINASSYSQWVYINFHDKSFVNVDIVTDSVTGKTSIDEPKEWDIAIHKFQVKTNNGSAIETEYTKLADLKAAKQLPDSTFKPDTWYENNVIVDLSGMMSGNIKYCSSNINDVVGRWISSSGMPPTYTTTNKVYVIRLEDGCDVALHFDSYMNNDGTKGYLTCSYEYPLTF